MKAICSACRRYKTMHKFRRHFCGGCVQVRDVSYARVLKARKVQRYAGK